MPDVPKEAPYSEAADWVFRVVGAEQEAKLFNTCWAKLPCYNSKLYYGYIICIYNTFQIFFMYWFRYKPSEKNAKNTLNDLGSMVPWLSMTSK